MEPWQEPVRGVQMPNGLKAMSGFDQLMTLSRGLVLPPPMFHLAGVAITQIGPGSVSLTAPATPWLQHRPLGSVAVMLTNSAIGTGSMTALPPGTQARPKTHSYAQLRPMPADGQTLIARVRVVHSTSVMVFAEATVEDARGRLVAQASGHTMVVPQDLPESSEPEPAPAPALTRVELPRYPTPDPYLRPLTSDTYATLSAFEEHSGLDAIRGIVAGELAPTPIQQLLGIRMIDCGPGFVACTMPASEWLTATYPTFVLPGWIEELAMDAAGAAGTTLLDPGIVPGVLSWHAVHLDAARINGPALSASAHAERIADDLISVQVDVRQDDGTPVAFASLTGRPFALVRHRPEPVRRILATVLFTDVVGSTEAARQLGDAKWSQIMHEHNQIVTSALDGAGGREIKKTGDGVLAVFDAPTSAIECACRIRDGIRSLGIEIRAGLHTGEIEASAGDIAGSTVNTASRIESTAGPGEVWVSETVKALAAGAPFRFKDQGRHSLKGIDAEMQLYSVED